jgi:hypothetical protein
MIYLKIGVKYFENMTFYSQDTTISSEYGWFFDNPKSELNNLTDNSMHDSNLCTTYLGKLTKCTVYLDTYVVFINLI